MTDNKRMSLTGRRRPRACLTGLLLAMACPVFADPILEQDRAKLLQHLERTRAMYLQMIDGVSPAQWTHKAAPDRWSIAECAEHIVTTEGLLLGLVQKLAKAPAPGSPPNNPMTDDAVLKFMTDRSQKAQAPEVLKPKTKYATPAEARAAFETARGTTVEYAKSTQDDLRSRYGQPSPRGTMDAYQFLLMASGHAERHLMQMQEVKDTPGYPK